MTEDRDNLDNLPAAAIKEQIRNLEKPVGQEDLQAETPQEEIVAPEAEQGQATEEVVEQPLILGKFKTQDDLIKSYQELEKRSTKAEQQRSQYRDAVTPYVDLDEDGNIVGYKTPTPPNYPQQPQVQQQPQVDVFDQLEERFTKLSDIYGPVRANIIINTEIAQAMRQKDAEYLHSLQAEKSIESQKAKLRSEPDFVEYEPEIDKFISKMDLQSKLNPNSVQTLYWMVKGKNFKQVAQKAEEEARLQTAAIEDQKKKAQVSHQTKTPSQPKIDINKLSAEELARQFNLRVAE